MTPRGDPPTCSQGSPRSALKAKVQAAISASSSALDDFSIMAGTRMISLWIVLPFIVNMIGQHLLQLLHAAFGVEGQEEGFALGLEE